MNFAEMIYKLVEFFWKDTTHYLSLIFLILILKGKTGKGSIWVRIKSGWVTFLESYRKNLAALNRTPYERMMSKRDRDIIDEGKKKKE